MTCIVGVAKDGIVWIGGDSCGSNEYRLTNRSDPKVWSDGDFVFGYTSSFRMGQLLRFKASVPSQPSWQSDYEYLCTSFVDAIRECFQENGFAKVENNVEQGGCFLMGYKGKLYTIESDYQVEESADGWDAVGSGDEVARGALFANEHLEPKQRIEQALKAAEYLAPAVRGPFVVEKLEAAV